MRRSAAIRSTMRHIVATMALLASGALAQAPEVVADAFATPATPVATAAPVAPLPANAPLTLRLQARQQAIAADLSLGADERRTLDTVLGGLLATSRALDDAAGRIASARNARKDRAAGSRPIDVASEFAAWQSRLPPIRPTSGRASCAWPTSCGRCGKASRT
jgi:hypothetical protein